MGTRNVRVTVMNVDEAGKLVLSPEQPDDGMPVVGTITDPDGVVSITNWAWATATSTRVATLRHHPLMQLRGREQRRCRTTLTRIGP